MGGMRHRVWSIVVAVAVVMVAMLLVPPLVDGWAPALAQPAASPVEVETPDVPTEPEVT